MHIYINIHKGRTKSISKYHRILQTSSGRWELVLQFLSWANLVGVAVNMKKAIHHFEILANNGRGDAHWHLAQMYKTEVGYVNEHCVMHHSRLKEASVRATRPVTGRKEFRQGYRPSRAEFYQG